MPEPLTFRGTDAKEFPIVQLADRFSMLVYRKVIATGRPEEIGATADVRAAYSGRTDAPTLT